MGIIVIKRSPNQKIRIARIVVALTTSEVTHLVHLQPSKRDFVENRDSTIEIRRAEKKLQTTMKIKSVRLRIFEKAPILSNAIIIDCWIRSRLGYHPLYK